MRHWNAQLFLVRAHAQLGQLDEAFAALDRLVAERVAIATQVAHDPSFDPLRSDPRFDEFLHAIGLA
jgi:hypothetical protein